MTALEASGAMTEQLGQPRGPSHIGWSDEHFPREDRVREDDKTESEREMSDEKVLLLVAVRADQPEVANRIKTILAASATYAEPPDTMAAVWAKGLSELTANDLDRLAGFIGWDRVRDLNVGDVVQDTASLDS